MAPSSSVVDIEVIEVQVAGLQGPPSSLYQSRAEAAAASINPGINWVLVAGRRYIRRASQPDPTAIQFQDMLGAYFELFEGSYEPTDADGASDDLNVDNAPAFNALTATGRATLSNTLHSYEFTLDLMGRNWRCDAPFNFTGFHPATVGFLRYGHGVSIANGGIISHATGKTALDFTGSRYIGVGDRGVLRVVGDEVDMPKVGVAFQRAVVDDRGPPAGSHAIPVLYTAGFFGLTGLFVYGAEEFEATFIQAENDVRDPTAYAAIFQGHDGQGQTAPSDFATPVTGVRSFIDGKAAHLIAGRLNQPAFTVSAISQTNPLVVTYTGTGNPLDTDEMVMNIPGAGGMVEFSDVVFFPSLIDTGAKTFVPLSKATGLPIDGTAFTAFVSGTLFYTTGPCIYICRSSNLHLLKVYSACYGYPNIVMERLDGFGDEGCIISMHGEGAGQPCIIEFRCNNDIYNLYNFQFTESANQANANIFNVVAGGADGHLTMTAPKITIGRIKTDLSGFVFSHPELCSLVAADITLRDGAIMNDISNFAAFTGQVKRLNGHPFLLEIGEKERTYEHEYIEDFLGVTPNSVFASVTIGSGGTAAATLPANSGGGTLVLTTGATAGNLAADGIQWIGNQTWSANAGELAWEFDVNMSAVDNVACFIGVSDQNSALEIPCTGGAGDIITPVADDFAGLFFDSAMDTDNWWLVARKNAGTLNQADVGVAPGTSASSFQRWRIEIDSGDDVTLYRQVDGTMVQFAVLNNSIKAGQLFGPYVCVLPRSASARILRLGRYRIREKQAITIE